jgi:hypothetical protein
VLAKSILQAQAEDLRPTLGIELRLKEVSDDRCYESQGLLRGKSLACAFRRS